VQEIGASFDILDKSKDGHLAANDVTRTRASSYGDAKEFFRQPSVQRNSQA